MSSLVVLVDGMKSDRNSEIAMIHDDYYRLSIFFVCLFDPATHFSTFFYAEAIFIKFIINSNNHANSNQKTFFLIKCH